MKSCTRIHTSGYQVKLLVEASNQAIQCGKCEHQVTPDCEEILCKKIQIAAKNQKQRE